MKNATVKSYPPVKVSEMEFLAQNVPGKMAFGDSCREGVSRRRFVKTDYIESPSYGYEPFTWGH